MVENLTTVDTVKLDAEVVHRLIMDRVQKSAEMAILDLKDTGVRVDLLPQHKSCSDTSITIEYRMLYYCCYSIVNPIIFFSLFSGRSCVSLSRKHSVVNRLFDR